MKEQFVVEMLARPSSAAGSGPGRSQQRQEDASSAQGSRPQSSAASDTPVAQQPDANSVRAKLELAKNTKLEAAKRKLQEGYQEFDNAKKQRSIQMVHPQNLPKQANNTQNFQPSGPAASQGMAATGIGSSSNSF